MDSRDEEYDHSEGIDLLKYLSNEGREYYLSQPLNNEPMSIDELNQPQPAVPDEFFENQYWKVEAQYDIDQLMAEL